MTSEKETYSVVRVTDDQKSNLAKITGIADLPSITGLFKHVGSKNDRYCYEHQSNQHLTLEFAENDNCRTWEIKWAGKNKNYTVAYCFSNSFLPPRTLGFTFFNETKDRP